MGTGDELEADDEQAFTIAFDTSSGDPTITDEYGVTIPIDADLQRFCDFLTWVSRRDISPFAEVEEGVYLTTHDAFENIARSAGHTFEVDLTAGVPHFRGAATIVWKGLPQFRFFALYRCVAVPEGTGQTAPNGIHGEPGPLFVSAKLFEWLNAQLGDESSTARCVSSWTVERAFVYVDVSDFSKYLPGQQVLVINSLIALVEGAEYWNAPGGRAVTDARNGREAELCIGDGYIFVFKRAIDATVFSAYLAALIESLVAKEALPVEFHFRIGVHFGPVFRFWDNGRRGWNYTGLGINGGQRVLSAVGKDADDIVFVSSAVRKRVLAEATATAFHRQLRAEMQNRGRRSDKHGKSWRVYELNHTAIATMLLPSRLRGGFDVSS
jgi:class 3 adenylate cyclase